MIWWMIDTVVAALTPFTWTYVKAGVLITVLLHCLREGYQRGQTLKEQQDQEDASKGIPKGTRTVIELCAALVVGALFGPYILAVEVMQTIGIMMGKKDRKEEKKKPGSTSIFVLRETTYSGDHDYTNPGDLPPVQDEEKEE